MKNSTFAMLALLLFHCPIFAQQWSSDPVIDRLKKSEAAILKFDELNNWCRQGGNSHNKGCDGINDNQPWTYMTYEDALKLGQKQLDEAKAKKDQEAKPPLTVVELVHQTQLLKKMAKEIADFCSTHPTKVCKTETPKNLALAMLPIVLEDEKAAKAKVAQEAASPASVKKPTQ